MKLLQKKINSKVTQFISLLHTYDFKDTNDGWTKVDNYVIGEDSIYFDPYVYFFNNLFYMYVSNRTTGTIELYNSKNGYSWEFIGTSLAGKKASWKDIVNRGCVVKRNNQYIMFYTGQFDGKSSIGVAISNDGIKFSELIESPIIVPSEPYEQNSVMNPCVIWDDKTNKYRMWYSAGEIIEPDVICYAESIDGVNWQKARSPVLEKGDFEYDKYKVGGCDVHITKNGFIMFYIGYQTLQNGRICVATSTDGYSWIRYANNPIISPSKRSWDAHAVYKPSVVATQDKLFLWYNGRYKNIERIGMAYKDIGEVKK